MRKTIDREKLVMILRRRFQSMKNDIEARMTGDTERVKLMTIRANEAYTILQCVKEGREEYL